MAPPSGHGAWSVNAGAATGALSVTGTVPAVAPGRVVEVVLVVVVIAARCASVGSCRSLPSPLSHAAPSTTTEQSSRRRSTARERTGGISDLSVSEPGRILGGDVHRWPTRPTLPQANEPCWCGSGRKYKRCHRRSEGRVLQGVVSPMRTVPPHIGRPSYADTGEPVAVGRARIKSPETIARMRRPAPSAAEILRLAGEFVRPGITTDEIDQYVHQLHVERDAYPSPLNYNGFPKSVCTSANEVICHGIPDSRSSRTATSSTSTSRPTSAACTVTPTPRSSSATSTRSAASS